MRKLPYQSSLQFIQRPQLLWNDIGDRKLWRGIQWIRRGPTVPSRLSWNAYQSNIPKPRSGVRWKHGMRRFSEYGNVAFRMINHQTPFFVGVLSVFTWPKRHAKSLPETLWPWSARPFQQVECHALPFTRLYVAPRCSLVPWLRFSSVSHGFPYWQWPFSRRTRWIGKEKCGFKEVEGNFVTGHHGFFLWHENYI